MLSAELDILNRTLSNNARVLYLLILRPGSHKATGVSQPLNFKLIKETLNAGGANISLGREINELLIELMSVGLISPLQEFQNNESLNGTQFRLNKMLEENEHDLHQHKTKMTINWQPNESVFKEISQLVGLLQQDFSKEELGEFITWWIGKPDQQFSAWQWTQKFILHLRKSRQIKGYTATSVVGYQQIEKQPEVILDDNTRKLIDKYHGKS